MDNTHCPKCGYTTEDQMIHGDHHLCTGKIPESGIVASGLPDYGKGWEGEKFSLLKDAETTVSDRTEAGIPESGETHRWRFDRKLAVEIMARFTGNSRGTPIAKKAFMDGAIWANELKSVSPPPQESQEGLIRDLLSNYTRSWLEVKSMSPEEAALIGRISDKFTITKR